MSEIQNHVEVAVDYYEKGITEERIAKLVSIWEERGFKLNFYVKDKNSVHIEVIKSIHMCNESLLRYEVLRAYDIAFGGKGTSNINPISITLSAG